jgi:heme exporter protein CcmD
MEGYGLFHWTAWGLTVALLVGCTVALFLLRDRRRLNGGRRSA